MEKFLRRFSFCVLCVVSASTLAAPIGMPQDAGRFGVAATLSHVSIDDAAGEVNSELAWPLTLVSSDRLRLGLRYWAELFRHSTKIKAEDDTIGLRLEQAGVRFSLQKELYLEPGVVTPWFGAGLEWSQYKVSQRHTVDGDGFLVQRFEDVSDSNVSVLVNLGREWEVARDLALGLKAEYAAALGDGPNVGSLGIVLLYDF